MTTEQTFVIVGAGLAGAKAAQSLREEGFGGRIVLIGAESERPYERPPLSKGYLIGKEERDKAYVHDEGWYAENAVELLLGHRVTGVDRAGHRVELDDGRTIGYHKLLLTPARLPVPSTCPAPTWTAFTTCAPSATRRSSVRPSGTVAGSSSWAPGGSGWRPRPPPGATAAR